jgi:hypothetical protein
VGSKSRIFFAAHLSVTNWKDEGAIVVEHDIGYLFFFHHLLASYYKAPLTKIQITYALVVTEERSFI